MCIAAFQLAMSFGLGLVVCHASNGHVAIESALEDCCPSGSLPESSRTLAPASDCDGCTDTPLRQAVLQRNASFEREMVAPPELFSLGVRFPSFGAVPSVAVTRAVGAPAAPLTLGARRSVVLRV